LKSKLGYLKKMSRLEHNRVTFPDNCKYSSTNADSNKNGMNSDSNRNRANSGSADWLKKD